MATKNAEKETGQTGEGKPDNPNSETEQEKPVDNTETGKTGPEPETPDYGDLEIISRSGDYSPKQGKTEKKKKPGEVGSDELADLFEVVYGVAASRFGAHWQLKKQEAKALGEATDAVLEKYGAKAQFGPEFSLVLVFTMTTGPRVLATKAQAQQQPADTGEGGQDGG